MLIFAGLPQATAAASAASFRRIADTEAEKSVFALHIWRFNLTIKTWLHPFCKRFYWWAAKKRSAPGDDI